MNRTVLVSLLVAVVVSSLFVTLYATGLITLPFGPEKTTPTTFKSTNTTATNQLLINSTKPAIQSVVVQGCSSSTVTLSNVKLPSDWYEVAVNASETCTVIVNLNYPSAYNVTFSGLSNGFAWASGGSVQLTIYTSFKVTNIRPTVDSYSFASSTNVTMTLGNTGNATATFVSYNVTDMNGNSWTRTGWSTPVIPPNGSVQTILLIGSSCPSCAYTGAPYAFNSFAIGNSYSITLWSSTNQSFKFTIVR